MAAALLVWKMHETIHQIPTLLDQLERKPPNVCAAPPQPHQHCVKSQQLKFLRPPAQFWTRQGSLPLQSLKNWPQLVADQYQLLTARQESLPGSRRRPHTWSTPRMTSLYMTTQLFGSILSYQLACFFCVNIISLSSFHPVSLHCICYLWLEKFVTVFTRPLKMIGWCDRAVSTIIKYKPKKNQI